MFCTRCGKQLEADANFCPVCGRQVTSGGGSPYVAPPAAAPPARPAAPQPVPAAYPGNRNPGPAPAAAYPPKPRRDTGKIVGAVVISLVACLIIGAAVWAGITASKRSQQVKVETTRLAIKSKAAEIAEQANVILNAQYELQTAGKPVEAARVEEAKTLAARALEMQDGFSPAMIQYARALSFQGPAQCDNAVDWFDRTIARATAPDLPAEDRDAAVKMAEEARVWKVATLTADGQAQLKSNNPALARQRFQAVIAAVDLNPAPNKKLADFKTFAVNELSKLAFVPNSGSNAPAPAPVAGNPDDPSIPSSTPGYPMPSLPVPSSTMPDQPGGARALPPDWTNNGGLPPGWDPDSLKGNSPRR